MPRAIWIIDARALLSVWYDKSILAARVTPGICGGTPHALSYAMNSTVPAKSTDKPDYTADPYLRVMLGIDLKLRAFVGAK